VQLETLAGLMAGRDGATAGLPGPAAWYEATTGRRLDEWQRAVVESDAGRMLLVCGRQVGKTEVVSASAAYRALHLGRRIGILSPTFRQSLIVFRRVRRLLLAANATLTRDALGVLDLPHGGHIIAFPGDDPDKAVRGETLEELIVDEAALIRDDVIAAATPTLATIADHREVHLGTPKGQRGEFYRQWTAGEGWERFSSRARSARGSGRRSWTGCGRGSGRRYSPKSLSAGSWSRQAACWTPSGWTRSSAPTSAPTPGRRG
jgi:hypothetical protein